jgi:retron-type reverse transcriptase
VRFPLRGGAWNATSGAGLGALNLNNLRAIVNNNVGLRPALPPSQMSGLYGGLSSAEGKRSRIPSPGSGENMNRHGRLVSIWHNIAHAVFFEGKIMPTTANNLWDKVIDFENVYHAYRDAAKGKRYQNEILDFRNNLEENLFTLIQELQDGTYKPLPLRHFYIQEPKLRLISAPSFRDRIVHHSLVQVIEPLFEKRFINETFACRKGRGTHAGVKHVFHCVQAAKRKWGRYYVLKCDVTKFFPSVNHDVLKQTIRRIIRDRRVLGLLDTIIDSYSTEGMEGVGIPIGTLTSQLMANVTLDPLDHHVKDMGVKFYARYMDDFVLIHRDKAFLREAWTDIEQFLSEKLALKLNPKTTIYPGKQGIDYCGYRIWPTHIKPRKSTIKRAKKRLKKFSAIYKDNPHILEHAKMSIMSFFGYIKHCSGYKITLSVLRNAVFKKPKKSKIQKN